jgi:hypothetical protein
LLVLINKQGGDMTAERSVCLGFVPQERIERRIVMLRGLMAEPMETAGNRIGFRKAP